MTDTPDTILDSVLFVARRFGWYLFEVDHPDLPVCIGIRTAAHDPATCKKRGKHPVVKFSMDATSTVADLAARFTGTTRNYGVATRRSRLLVLDVDDAAALDGLLADRGETLPETFEVSTGRGRHLYYSVPRESAVGNAALCPGVDVRAGADGYVVGPGSKHASGAVYAATWDRRPSPAPEWLVDFLVAKVVTKTTSIAIAEPLDRKVPDRVAELLARPSGDRSAQFHQIVAELKRAKFTQGQVVAVLSPWCAQHENKYAGREAAEVARSWDRVEGEQEENHFPSPSNPMAVARQIIRGFGRPRTLRHWRGTWMRWEGTHWAEVDDREIRSTVYRRLEKATYTHVTVVKGVEVEEERPWLPTRRKIVDLMEAAAAVTHLSSAVDPPVWLARTGTHSQFLHIAAENGLLNVHTRELVEHTPDYFNLASVPFSYDPEAAEPKRWLEFLESLWPDDPASIEALQEYFGYVLSGRTDLHKILLIVGPTRAGKGTVVRALEMLVGKSNIAGPTLSSLATNFGLAPLLGKPLAVISDARLGGGNVHQVVERLLSVSGEDTLTVDRKYREPWTGCIGARIVILSNELPSFGDASGAIAHRFIALVLTRSWLGKEDITLGPALAAEAGGILNWALDGLVRLTETGRFTEPASAVEAIITMKDNASPMSAFVRENCEIGPTHEVVVDALFAAWKTWCEENGRERPGTKQAFGRNLRAVVPGVRVTQPRDGDVRLRVYQGIGAKGWNHNGSARVPVRASDPDEDTGDDPARTGTRENPLWPPQSDEPACVVCGRPLLLVRPGRDVCEACRIAGGAR